MSMQRPAAGKRESKTNSSKGLPSLRGATRARIIERSMLLFNRNGLRDVAIERIAQDLDISVGNLTYHFPRKQQLIAATLQVVKAQLRTALEQPTDVRSAADGAAYLLRLYRTLWEHRFFFNALTYVLTVPELRREYEVFRRWALQTIEKDLGVLCAQGYFLPPAPPNTFPLLAENMWSLWLNWLRMQHIISPRAKTPGSAALYDCALHNWSLCQPWMQQDYARELLKIFAQLRPAPRERRSRAVPASTAK